MPSLFSRILTLELFNGVAFSDCATESDIDSESYIVNVSAHASPINLPAECFNSVVGRPNIM